MEIEKVSTDELIKSYNLIADYLKYLNNLLINLEKSDNNE